MTGVSGPRQRANSFAGREAVDLGHAHIQKNTVGLLARERRHPLGPADRENDAVAFVLERAFAKQTVRLVVVDDQDGRGVEGSVDIALAIVRFGDRRPSTATSENLPNTEARAPVFLSSTAESACRFPLGNFKVPFRACGRPRGSNAARRQRAGGRSGGLPSRRPRSSAREQDHACARA